MRAKRQGGGGAGRRAGVMAPLLCLALAACSVPDEVNPVSIYRRISGAADADRLPPPGMDRPTPSLHTVPPRPERPAPEVREAISAALADDRARSRDPLVLRTVPAPGARGGMTLGEPPMPAAPPPRPALAGAPRIPWNDAPVAPRAQPQAAPAAPGAPAPPALAPALPEMPEEAPAPPPPDLLGPPPRPR
ncbi:hypothetical protein [Roseicella aerolata]|uniref:Uncharacterized protein n=1 Tax=Roseicella aerolata TaxID=2883479 RepID=A0A9X1IEV0_9PROT|nr:hypothetical protein [Roseicella aerolata]MCB4822916.1 hypothetical protein [Roseicella aerolata]